MLLTVPEGELFLDRSLAPHGERSWGFLRVTPSESLFLVSYRTKGDQGAPADILVLGVERLREIARGGGVLQITAAQLLSPPWLNGSAHWKLEPLGEIRAPADTLFTGRDYVLNDGRTYSEPREAESSEYVPYETLFSMQRRSV
jgi:hypothetical protein